MGDLFALCTPLGNTSRSCSAAFTDFFLDLTFIGTDPAHARRGAATWMVRWGMEQAIKNNSLAYLESTIEAAPFYEKTGFTATANISLVLEGTAEKEGSEIYREIVFIFRP